MNETSMILELQAESGLLWHFTVLDDQDCNGYIQHVALIV